MSQAAVTVSAMDTSVILYAAEIEAPALEETARRSSRLRPTGSACRSTSPTSCCPRTAGCGDKWDHAE
jgi:hypothetical protein